MKGTTLNLSSAWRIGDQLGAGGFGRVFELSGGSTPAVAKFVPKEPGADRELLFADLNGVQNVVPIMDSGEYQENWVLVMPRADKSLREHLDENDGVLALADARDGNDRNTMMIGAGGAPGFRLRIGEGYYDLLVRAVMEHPLNQADFPWRQECSYSAGSGVTGGADVVIVGVSS